MKIAAKDFKMTELGPIPKDWEVKRFDDCFDFAAAGDLREECYNRERVGNCVYPIFSNSLANKGLYGYTSSPRYKADSITITGRGTLGHAEYRGEAFDAIIRLLILTPKQEVDCRFVVDWINHINPFVNESTSIPQLTVPQVAGSWFVFPPLPEQRKISAALSDVDEMIAALEKLIEKKRKIKTGAMQRLLIGPSSPDGFAVTGKTRLPGFKGAWVEKRLGEFGETYNGIGGKTKDDFGKGPARYITFLNVLTNPVLDETLFEPVNVLPADGQNRAKKGDLFFNTSSETPEEVGICSMLATDQAELYLNSFCFGFRLFDDNVSPLFLSYYFRSADGRLLMTTLAQGSTRYNLSKESFKDACIAIPPTLAEQKAIAKVLGDMDEEIAALEAELAKTRQLKQGMMQELLTGKVRLV